MLLPKKNIEKLVPATHGGINYSELKASGINPEDIIDFSVSTNPFGPPPVIRELLSSTTIDTYPDSESSELNNALAEKLGIDVNNIIIGSGSTELIRMTALAYFGTGDSVLIPQPTYSEYEVASNLTGAKVLKQPVRQEPDFQLNIPECLDLISKNKPKGIFLCNPNNPTGQYINKDEIEKIITNARNTLIIIDEAYIAFTDNAWSSSSLISYDNIVIIRSMTKDYALAGIRLGYAIAGEPIISILKRVRAPWNVSSIAQKAGIFAIKNDRYLKECTVKIQIAKKQLEKELKILGLTPLPSSTNFFMIKVNNATQFRRSLLEKGILVRDCTSFGLPDHIRLGARSLNDCEKLIEAIKLTGVHRYAS